MNPIWFEDEISLVQVRINKINQQKEETIFNDREAIMTNESPAEAKGYYPFFTLTVRHHRNIQKKTYAHLFLDF